MPLAYANSACSAPCPRLGSSSARPHPSTQALQTTDASHGRISRRRRCGITMFPKRLIGPLHDDCMCVCLTTESSEQSYALSTLWKLYPIVRPRVSSKISSKKRDHKLAPRSRSGVPRCGLLEAVRLAGEWLSREPAFAGEIATDV